ncbi:surface-adhesin E family protein [Acinetobacter vivianii]|uniref:surface-adhesin E family protein n=1 Tax=Acinetobacter vivianii TaxID=1776742 RepID=UPI003D03A674
MSNEGIMANFCMGLNLNGCYNSVNFEGVLVFKKLLILSLSSMSTIAAANLDVKAWKENYIQLDDEKRQEVKETLSSKGWLSVSASKEFEAYINFNYVEVLSNGLTQAWIKNVVINDISKDGLGLGDYTMYLYQFNCQNKTSKMLSYTDYDVKTGLSKKSYTYPSYGQMKPVIPDSVGETQLEVACFVTYVKNN